MSSAKDRKCRKAEPQLAGLVVLATEELVLKLCVLVSIKSANT